MTTPTFETDDDIAESLGMTPEAYAEMTPQSRGLARAHTVTRLKSAARKLGVDGDWWCARSPAEREGWKRHIEEGNAVPPEAKPKPAVIKRVPVPRPAPPPREPEPEQVFVEAPEPEADGDPDDPEDPPLRIYSDRDEAPATEPDPRKRDGMTIGAITELETPPDHMGTARDADPRTLQDLYARWPIGDGQHYLRVERTQPKVFQQVACAGYLGDIRDKISERTFQRYFGGREFEVTLYGPDPRGKHDVDTGLPKVKALTKPVKIVVPMLPPNLAVLPALETNAEAKEQNKMTQPWNPFAPSGVPMAPMSMPSSAADAQIHKTNVDLLTNVFKVQQEDLNALRKERQGGNGDSAKTILDYSTRTTDQILQQSRADAEAREKILHAQLSASNDELKRIRDELRSVTGKSDGSTIEIVKALGGATGDRAQAQAEWHNQQIVQLQTAHQAQLDVLRRSNEDAIKHLKDVHEQDTKHAEQRRKDLEEDYRRRMDDMTRKADERDKDLRAELDRVRREEREMSDKRLHDAKERQDERLADLKHSYEAQLKSLKENLETRAHVSLSTKDFELTTIRERLAEAKADAEKAREDAEEASDPVKAKEKVDKLAEAFGFEKKDADKPNGPLERFAATAGVGVAQAMGNIDQWLPVAAAIIRGTPPPGAGQPGTPQLPPGQAQQQAHPNQQPAQQAQQQRPARRRAVAWAGTGQDVQPTNLPNTPMGFQPAGPPPPEPSQSATGQTPAAQTPLQHAAQAAEQGTPQPQPAVQPQRASVQNALSAVFTNEAVDQFLRNLEGAINIGMTPADFAQRFVHTYPEPAFRLVAMYKPADVVAFTKTLPGGETTAITRRDGAQFIDALWDEIKKLRGPQQPPQAEASAA
jgi:hypothetical protein